VKFCRRLTLAQAAPKGASCGTKTSLKWHLSIALAAIALIGYHLMVQSYEKILTFANFSLKKHLKTDYFK
jgi:hypothetical protein